jgi:hypothetical protein
MFRRDLKSPSNARLQSLMPHAFLCSIVVFRPHRGPRRFLLRLVTLIGEELLLRAPRASSLLPANSRDFLLLGRFGASQLRFDFVQQDSARQETIERLRALLLAFHPNARGPVMQHDTAGSLVDLLPAGAGRANELFFDVLLANAQGLHALQQGFFFAG